MLLLVLVTGYANGLDKQTRLYFKDHFISCMWQITIFIKQPWNHDYILQGPNNQAGMYCIIPALI